MSEETVNQGTTQEAGTKPAEVQAGAEAKAAETKAAEGQQNADQGRTFSQAEVDAIIGDRLTRERAKYADYEDLKKQAASAVSAAEALQTEKSRAAELQAKLDALQKDIEARNARDKVSAETGVPASVLTGQTEEECKAQADKIIKWRGNQPNYPTVPDGGTVNPFTGGKTRDQFASWAKANLNI